MARGPRRGARHVDLAGDRHGVGAAIRPAPVPGHQVHDRRRDCDRRQAAAAARRPRSPPKATQSAEQAIQSLERSAARESPRRAASIAGVGVAAIAGVDGHVEAHGLLPPLPAVRRGAVVARRRHVRPRPGACPASADAGRGRDADPAASRAEIPIRRAPAGSRTPAAAWVDRLAVDAGVRAGALASRLVAVHDRPGVRAIARPVEEGPGRPAAVERGASARCRRPFQRIGPVRDEHHGEPSVLAAEVVHETQPGASAVGPSRARAVASSVRTFASRYAASWTASP